MVVVWWCQQQERTPSQNKHVNVAISISACPSSISHLPPTLSCTHPNTKLTAWPSYLFLHVYYLNQLRCVVCCIGWFHCCLSCFLSPFQLALHEDLILLVPFSFSTILFVIPFLFCTVVRCL